MMDKKQELKILGSVLASRGRVLDYILPCLDFDKFSEMIDTLILKEQILHEKVNEQDILCRMEELKETCWNENNDSLEAAWSTREEWDNFMVGFAFGCVFILVILGIWVVVYGW